MKDKQINDCSELRNELLNSAHVGIGGMKELAENGQEVAMAKFEVESAVAMLRAWVVELKARGHKPDVERWKGEARESFSPEQYLIWEERVLPYRLLAWQAAGQVSNADEPEDPNESKKEP